MNKYSRRHGLMWLSSYAPGDGSIDFVWVPNGNRNGECLSEFVSESDISEWLGTDEEKNKWHGWEIITIGRASARHTPSMNRLAKSVIRPFHTSTKLKMGDVVYEYVYHGPVDPPDMYSSNNTDIYEVGDDRERIKVRNIGIIMSLCFFLNHEKDFETSGMETRQRK